MIFRLLSARLYGEGIKKTNRPRGLLVFSDIEKSNYLTKQSTFSKFT